MSIGRAKVLSRLASLGLPPLWANEAEAAVLSGMSPEQFRQKVKELEKDGFPKVNERNGKRPIPDILAFWGIKRGEPKQVNLDDLVCWEER